MALEQEMATYRRELPQLLAQGREGQFVLIKMDQVIGTWSVDTEALAEGDRRFPGQPFLVKQIHRQEKPLPILMSGIHPCR